MDTNRRFSLTQQALTELASEVPTVSSVPPLSTVLAEVGSIPSGVILLGVASDGMPVLLNLRDPHPGPVLIAGDAGSGKTVFLRTIAHSVAQTEPSGNVRLGVITNYPDEWEDAKALPQQAGVFAVGRRDAQEFIRSLAGWAHTSKNTRQYMLLLVDDLESVASLDLQAARDFRWLLLRGPVRHVWPIVTLNAPRYGQVMTWLQSFRTRIFGRIADGRVAAALGGDKASGLTALEPRIQFALPERENWLRFWLPSC